MSARRAARPLERVLDHLRAEPSRTWSIIVTLYGDAIVPRGGSVWLGTVLEFCARLGIADGVVRTAMSRLAADGWLERRRAGRNSFYALAARGRDTFRAASTHIYTQTPPPWRGAFTLVIPASGGDRDAVRAALAAAGFGGLAAEVWIAPAPRPVPGGVTAEVVAELSGDGDAQRALAARAWPLETLAAAYDRFVDAFAPLHDAVSARGLDDLDALAARVLLVHEYRRIVLRDPILPAAVLPERWPGATARRLCADIYGRVLAASERWLDAHAIDESGRRLPAASGLRRRFAAPRSRDVTEQA